MQRFSILTNHSKRLTTQHSLLHTHIPSLEPEANMQGATCLSITAYQLLPIHTDGTAVGGDLVQYLGQQLFGM